MDLLCLKVSARIMGEKSKSSRDVPAALLGASYSILAITVLPKGIIFALLWISVAYLMVKISIPSKSLGETSGALLAFFLCSSLSGGITEASGNVYRFIISREIDHSLLSLLLCVIGLIAFIPFSHKAKSVSKMKSIGVKLSLLGIEYSLDCLIDSGNLAKEPISGLDVMILSKKAPCVSQAKRICEEKTLPFYCVELSGIGGKKLLYGIRPDYISFKNKKTNKIIICSDDGISDFCGNDAVIPAGIF
jgi:hypothetical protein